MITTRKERDGGVVRLVLDSPKGNVLDGAMIGAIDAALDAHVGPNVKLLVFEGAGKNFSFGASVEEHQRDRAAAMLASFHGLFRKLASLAVPTCAVVRGQCLGGGLELAGYATFVVATPDARLGQPEIKLAVFAPMASIILPWRIGGAAALDLLITGRTIEAAEAKRVGLVSEVTDDPDGYVQVLFEERLRPLSASSLRFAERAARVELRRRIEDSLPALERLYLEELMATHDANEGILAFLERREPALRNA